MASGTNTHREYTARITWTGNRGEGTSGYAAYGRDHVISIDGKVAIEGSAEAAFCGDAEKHNPEDLFLSALGSCHMLFFLSLAARSGIRITAYEDQVRGRIAISPEGGGAFDEITLSPVVTVTEAGMIDEARELHASAHKRCFIANSCSVPVHVVPLVRST